MMIKFVYEEKGKKSTLDDLIARYLSFGGYDPVRLRQIWQQRTEYVSNHPFWQGWETVGTVDIGYATIIVKRKSMPSDRPFPPGVDPNNALSLWQNSNAVEKSGNFYDLSMWAQVKKMFPLKPALVAA